MEHAITYCYSYMFNIEHVVIMKIIKLLFKLNKLATTFYSQAEHLFMQQRHQGRVMSKL